MNRTLLAFMLAVCSVTTAQVPEYVPAEGLVGWWSFDGDIEDDGPMALPSTSEGVGLEADRFGFSDMAAAFDGLDDQIRVLHSESLNLTEELTVVAWIKSVDIPFGGNSHCIAAKRDEANYPSSIGTECPWTFSVNYQSWIEDRKKLLFGYQSNNDWSFYQSQDTISTEVWAHVAMTVFQDSIVFYHNSEVIGFHSVPLTGRSTNGSDMLIGSVGREAGAEYFKGSMDDLGIWNRALSPTEIQTLFTLTPLGCTDASACNYDASAIEDDGSCEYETCAGCMDAAACNYDASAIENDGSCTYPAAGYDCEENCINDADADGTCDEFEVNGCTDAAACNYNANSTEDDGSCLYPETPGFDCNGDCLDINADGECDYGLQLIWQTIEENIGVQGGIDLSGYNTYRLYVESTGNLNISVFGGGQINGSGDINPINFVCDGELYNSELMNYTYAWEINPLLFNSFPQLNYDSWWTLGIDQTPNYAVDECQPIEVQTSNGTYFETETVWISNDPIGPFIYVYSGCSNGIPNEDNRVLIGQFTVTGEIGVELAVQGVSESGDQNTVQLSAFTGDISGCLAENACNYLPLVTEEVDCIFQDALGDCGGTCDSDENSDGICDHDQILGCTDQDACGYNADATHDDGSCEYVTCAGCMDTAACNFDATATIETNEYSCLYNDAVGDCGGTCDSDENSDGICDHDQILGCTDQDACGYNADATHDDGSCEYVTCAGCMDAAACNFDATATIETNEYSCLYNDAVGDCGGTCDSDENSDGICDHDQILGCTDQEACGYNADATHDDGSCVYPDTGYDCNGVCLSDVDNDGICDEDDAEGCTDPEATNFNSHATSSLPGQCTYTVNFLLDAQSAGLEPNQAAWITGSMGDFGGADIQMTPLPDADYLWTASVELADGTYSYVYSSGSYALWESDLEGTSCDANPSPSQTNRLISVQGNMDVSDCWNCTCEGFVAGCDDPLSCNYNPDANLNDGSCLYPETPGFDCNGDCLDINDDGECDYGLQLIWETVEENIGIVGPDPNGVTTDLSDYTTYRLYVESTGNLNISVIGGGDFNNQSHPISFVSTGDAYNSEIVDFGYASEIDPVLNSIIPQLNYDSWWTLGIDQQPNAAIGECSPAVVNASDGTVFETETTWTSDDPFGPFMYVLPQSCSNGIPNEDHRVLIGQFTVTGEIGVEMTVQGVTESNDQQHTVQLSAFTGDISGCLAENACNYSPLVTEEVDCIFQDAVGDCGGACLEDINDNGLCDAQETQGCTSNTACNYDPTATLEDSSCIFPTPMSPCGTAIPGCTDSSACNYDVAATDDDGTCAYPTSSYDCNGQCWFDIDTDGICDEFEVNGCSDDAACNYNADATDDDGSCDYSTCLGCTDPDALNYDAEATTEDGSCIDGGVTFQVDMSQYPFGSNDQVYVTGSFNGWCGSCNPMEDEDGDNIWTITLELAAGEYEYKFLVNGWDVQEGWGYPGSLTVGAECDYNPDDDFPNRGFVYDGNGLILDVVCFANCDPCDSLVMFDVTFLVDLSQHEGEFETAYVNGDFNAWCGDCNPMTDNGDGTWQITLPLQAGDIKYKFTLDGWTESEDLPAASSCTIQDELGIYRFTDISESTDLGLVCYGSCNACGEEEVLGCQDATASNYNPLATVDSGCIYNSPNLSIQELVSEGFTGFASTSGIVTSVFPAHQLFYNNSAFSIQNGTGPHSGIWILGTGVSVGDSISIHGNVAQVNGIPLIEDPVITVEAAQLNLPTPALLTSQDIQLIEWLGVLCQIHGTCSNSNAGNGNWHVTDQQGTSIVEDFGYNAIAAGAVEEGIVYDVIGPVFQVLQQARICPRDAADVLRYGCTTESAPNFDPLSNQDDNSCLPGIDQWTQIGQTITEDWSGQAFSSTYVHSVSISDDGSTLAVIAEGNSRIFELHNDVWTETLNAQNNPYNGSPIVTCLSGNGEVAAVSMHDGDFAGIQFFEKAANAWVPVNSMMDITMAPKSAKLSYDGSVIIVGNMHVNTAQVYERVGDVNYSEWHQIGQDFTGLDGWYLGNVVDISASGDTIAIGSQSDNTLGHNRGSCSLYVRDGDNWSMLGQKINGVANYDQLHSLALSSDGSRVVLGSYGNDEGGELAGQVRVFDWNESAQLWQLVGSPINGTQPDQRIGEFVSISGNGQVIGTHQFELTNGGYQEYRLIGDSWSNVFNLFNTCNGCEFGSVFDYSFAGDTIAIVSQYGDTDIPYSDGSVQVFYTDFQCDDYTSVYDCEGNCNNDQDSDGICDEDEVAGCTDTGACNYDPLATEDDASCFTDAIVLEINIDTDFYGEETSWALYDADGHEIAFVPSGSYDDNSSYQDAIEICIGCYSLHVYDTYGDGIICEGASQNNGYSVSLGDSLLGGDCDFGTESILDFCTDVIGGCTDSVACNFINWVTWDDGSCLYELDACGVCGGDGAACSGCTDPMACNFDPDASIDDGSCNDDTDQDGICDGDEVLGCTDLEACNYDGNATEDDGSCLDPSIYDATCQCQNDTNFNLICDELETSGCTNPGACNFDPAAGLDDGSCEFAAAGYDCAGQCTLAGPNSTCLQPLDFVCERNSVVAAEGDIYGGAPEDVPSFYAVDASNDLSIWGAIPNSPWLDNHPTLTGSSQDLGAVFSGAWGTTVLVDTAGTIMNPGEVNAYGIYLPPLQNVIKVDNGEFQILILDESGDIESFGFDDPMYNFSVPFDVVLADIVDIACTMENNVAVDSEGEIHVWGASWTIGELGYGMPSDVVGNWIAVDGTWSELVGITDAGDAAVWPYDASLTDNWKTQFNAHDWLADPAVDAKIAQDWACVLTQSGSLIYFSSDSFISTDAGTYAELMPPPSFGPVVDFDISQTGLIAKNANGRIHSAFVPVWAQEDLWWLDQLTVTSAVPSAEYANPLCIPGCTQSWATNYSPSANEDDGSCLLAGCIDPMACNFDPLATTDDGSCELPDVFDCDGVTCLNDINDNGICDELEDPGCHIATACNFDPEAVLGDINLCEFPEAWRDCEGNCLLDLNGDGTCDRMTDYLCGVGEIIQVDPNQNGPSGLFKTARILVEGGYYEVEDSILNLSFNSLEGDIQGLIGTPVQSYGGEGAGVWVVGVGRDSLLQDLNLPASFVSAAEAEEGFDATPTTLKFASVEAGRQYFVGVDSAGTLHGWGALEPEFAPTLVPAFPNVTAVDTDEDGVVAVNASGATYWGSHFQYPLLEIPAYVLDAPEDIVELELSYQNGFALMSDGDVISWGTFNDGYTVVPNHLDSIIRMTSAGPISYDAMTIGLLDADGHIGLMDFGSPTLSNAVFSNIIAMSPGMTHGRFLALRGDGMLIECQLDSETDEYMLNVLDLPDFSPVLCIPGCMDISATNFQELATWDDGTCLYEGCTDPTAFNYDPEAVNDDGSCVTSGCVDPDACNYDSAAEYGLRLETVAVHDGLVGETDLSGYTTYRLYVDLPDSSDFVSAVYGNDQDTLQLLTSGDFYQSPLGGVTPNAINPFFFSIIPELEYDSWVTIGNDGVPSPGSQAISTVEDADAPWISAFESGSGLEVNTMTGGSWYIVNNGTALNGFAGADRTVLLGQFTTNGELTGNLQIQFFPGGIGSNNQVLALPLENACSYAAPFYDCAGQCLSDGDGDGVCDELEVPGCMNPEACNYNPSATDEDGTCRISSGQVSIVLDEHEIHEGMVGSYDLTGHTTYRLFAELDQPEDQLVAVFGDAENEMAVQSTSSFWHHPLGAITGGDIQPALLGTFPALAYDSYVTIGSTEFSALDGQVELAESPDAADQWLPAFTDGGNIEVNSVTGGGWFVVPGSSPFPNTLPDDSGRVLLGQFTTEGLMYGQLNVQVEACGAGTVQAFDLDFGASPELIGCTDPTACNYSELAVEDDGSCCFEHCLELFGMAEAVVNRQTGDTLSSVDRYDGSREYCLETGCYVILGSPMDSVQHGGAVLFLSSDSLLISTGDILCDGCQDERACNYDPDAIFDNGDCAVIIADIDDPANFNVGISDLLILLSDFGCQANCVADLDNDGQVGAQDLLSMLSIFGDDCEDQFSGCTDPSACNFSPLFIFDDGSCTYPDGEGNCD